MGLATLLGGAKRRVMTARRLPHSGSAMKDKGQSPSLIGALVLAAVLLAAVWLLLDVSKSLIGLAPTAVLAVAALSICLWLLSRSR